jgi:hypothetical protein
MTQPNAGQNTLLFSMCGTILPSSNGVLQTWWSQQLVQPLLPLTSTYILVHWVGYEATTLRKETSSPTTKPVEKKE